MYNFQQDLTLQGARRRLWDHPGTLLAKQVSRLIFQIRFTDVCWFGVAVGLHFRTFWLTFDALAGSLGPPWSASGNRLKKSQKNHFWGPPFRPPFHYIFLLFWCFVFASFCNLSPTSFLVPKRLQASISKVPRGAKKHKKTKEKEKGESESEKTLNECPEPRSARACAVETQIDIFLENLTCHWKYLHLSSLFASFLVPFASRFSGHFVFVNSTISGHISHFRVSIWPPILATFCNYFDRPFQARKKRKNRNGDGISLRPPWTHLR